MPELPEVETVCRGLSKSLLGARVSDAFVRHIALRKPMPKGLESKLKGRTIEKIERRAKYILISLDNRTTLAIHLGMSGRLVLSHNQSSPQKHDHIVLSFDNGMIARFNDPRRFGFCDIAPTEDLPKRKWMTTLGTEPLSPDFTPKLLHSLLKGRKTTIKAALLDQKLMAGIGNIYACEALFLAGIDPRREARTITEKETIKLTSAIRSVLTAAIKAGGSTLRDYVQADGKTGSFQNHFAVYAKEGQRCPDCDCDASKTKGIARITQNGRSTFFCAKKQK